MHEIQNALKSAANAYNKGYDHTKLTLDTCIIAHKKIISETNFVTFGNFSGTPPVTYSVFEYASIPSRPVRTDLFIYDHDKFLVNLSNLISLLRIGSEDWTDDEILLVNTTVYTSVISFSCCYDTWKRSSRKTPGTFFEIFIAALVMQILPKARLTKHIELPKLSNIDNEKQSLSTDLVVNNPDGVGGLVIPLKITTRERIVQPYAHQRILDSAFGVGVYQSILICLSETQLDIKNRAVKQVCVPGTVRLFQKHLSSLNGIYYGDVPQRYEMNDVTDLVPVGNIGEFFAKLPNIYDGYNASRN